MEYIREKVWKQPGFCIFHTFNVTDQPQGRSISHTSYHSVQSYFFELIHKRFHADPVIAQEHHSFFPTFMGDVHQLFCQLRYLSSLERLEILEFLRRYTVGIIHIALIDDIFRPERIADFLLELFQNIRADRCRISIPIHIFFPCQFIKHKRELMEKCGISNHINMRIIRDIFTKTIQRILMGFGLAHIESDLLFKICPSISHCIVHMHRIPHNICKKADGIIVKCYRLMDRDVSSLSIVIPLRYRNHFSSCTVNDFPPSGDIIMIVDLQHIRVQMIHQMNRQFTVHSRIKWCHDIHLLDFVRICLCPLIILSSRIICRINLRIYTSQFFGIISPIAIPDCVCPPAL